MRDRWSPILFRLVVSALVFSACSVDLPSGARLNIFNITDSIPSQTPTVAPIAESTLDIFANKGWQNTHILVRKGERVTVQYVAGLWTEQYGVVTPHDSGDKNGYVCGKADCAEPYPDVPKGMLIGRIGWQLIAIGTGQTFIAQADGMMALRINDADSGLDDNFGAVTVQIKVERAY